MSDETAREEISNELQRIEESGGYSAQSQFQQSKLWRSMHLSLGIPATALAAVAGGTLLAETVGAGTAGILALLAAGIGAVATILNAPERARQAQASAADYQALENDARIARKVDLARDDVGAARGQLDRLASRRNELNSKAAPPSFFAYWLGKKQIEKGRQIYEIDKGSG